MKNKLSLAWDAFGEDNGAKSLDELYTLPISSFLLIGEDLAIMCIFGFIHTGALAGEKRKPTNLFEPF
jgi:hypothetical protein